MKRSSAAPNISAPLSRSGARRSKSSLNPICVAATTTLLLILISLGGALLFFSRSNHLESHNNQGEAQEQFSSQLRRQQKQSTEDSIREEKRNVSNTRGLLIRTNQIGDIRISFRPDLSGPTSIQYIIDVMEAAAASSPQTDGSNNNGVTCDRCKFYRAETKLLLQGVIAQHSVPNSEVTLGPCPIENYKPKLECPPHDPNCGCHGPVMTKGMVGWAGGAKGPDFFLNTFEREVDWWENQHTVWGELDEESIRVVESAYDLPAHGKGMRMLDEAINFSIELF